MLTLNRRIPVTFEVLGAAFTFAPIDGAMWRAARIAAAKVRNVEDDPESGELNMAIREAVGVELLRRGMTGWSEIVDGNGKPLPFSPAALDDLLADPIIAESLDALYVVPFLNRATEKNALSSSPTGTGAGAMPDKATARKAATPRKASAAKSVPTPPKKR